MVFFQFGFVISPHNDVITGTSWILMAQDIRMTCSLATPLFSGSGTNLLDAI